jgi:hypothetical protein
MILIFLLSLLGDDNTLYLMDKSFSLIPIEEEFRFLYSKNGFQTTQGSRDSEEWYEIYRIKIWVPLFSRMIFEYKLQKEDDYDIDTEEHLFKLLWTPEEKTKIPLSFSLFLSPQSSQNKKYIGIGFGYWKNYKDNHSLNIAIHEFDHSYTRLPISIELNGKVNSSQADLNYRYYKTIPGKKNFLYDDIQTDRGEYGGMGLKNTIYYHLFARISPGLRLDYSEIDSSYFSLPEDTLSYAAKINNFFAESLIKTEISDKSTFYIGLPMNWKYIKNDSLEYKRNWIGLTLLYNHTILDYMELMIGLQKSWRNLNGQKNDETRGVLGLELKFNQTTYIVVRQGIELDFPLPKKLKEYNNHTYLMFTHCF